jgi:hypothetical protein
MRSASQKPVRCAIYTRVSTEVGLDQDFNSLDAQYDAAQAYSHVREALAIWRDDYNTVRPHSALANLPPATSAKLSAPVKQRDGALRYVEGYAPRPVASPSHQGSNEARTLPISG